MALIIKRSTISLNIRKSIDHYQLISTFILIHFHVSFEAHALGIFCFMAIYATLTAREYFSVLNLLLILWPHKVTGKERNNFDGSYLQRSLVVCRENKNKKIFYFGFLQSPIVHISTNAHRHSFLTELFHIKDKSEMTLDNKKEC